MISRPIKLPGSVFPPRHVADIAAYTPEQVIMGYLDHRVGDPVPGPNSTPAFRWGALNRLRDNQPDDDGYDALRKAFIADYEARHMPTEGRA